MNQVYISGGFLRNRTLERGRKKNSEIDVARCGHEKERETKLIHKEIMNLGLYKGETALRSACYSVNEKAEIV